MKKIFTLAAAVLASFSLWAVDPTYESSEWATQADAEAALGAHNHVTLAQSGLSYGNLGSNGSFYYVAASQNLKSSDSPWKYFSIVADENYLIDSVSVWYCENGSNETNVAWIGWGEGETPATKSLAHGETAGTKGSKKLADAKWVTIDAHTYDIQTMYLSRSIREFQDAEEKSISNFGKSQTFNILGFKVWLRKACTDPEAVLKLSKTSMFVNEQAHLDFTTKGTSEDWGIYVKKDGENATYGVDYSLSSYPAMYPVSIDVTPLKAGTFELTAFQESDGTYCALEKSVTVTVSEANPVTAVTVDGPTAAYVGEAVTFTATAANASDYAWTVNGVDANTNAAEFTYTPAAAGEYNIVCSARNQFNAAEEWIASEAKVLTASTVSGVLVSYTVNSDANGAANLSGALAAKATAKVSLTKKSSNKLTVDEVEYTGFKMDKGCYAGVTLTSGSFQEGDTVSFMVTNASGTAKLYLYDDEKGTKRLDSIAFSGQTGWATFVLNQATTGVYLYRLNPDVKPYDQNPYVAALKVIRPKAVDHADVALVGVAIDGEALLPDFVTHLINEGTFTIQTSYVNAPVVAFVKHTDTYYEGETEPVSTNDSIKVTATDVDGQWQAQATIGANTYTINMKKASSFTVHYMDGTTELGTENVAVNGTVAEYAKYQSKSLYSFVGWYQDVDLTIEAVLTAPITAETYLYAKFEEKYATSINIEKAVMENGKGYAIINQLGTLGYATNITGSLDSLDNSKDQRNYAYLGLKVKQNGALLNFRLEAGKTVTIKFGEIKKTPNVSINGGDYADMTITDKVYTHTAGEADELISIKMMDGNAVVFQQIMIGEALQAPALFAINCAEAQNGSVDAPFTLGIPGEKITLTVTPAEAYKVENVTLNGETVEAVENVYSFTMPENVANVAATFVEDTASALGNTEAEAKAVKVVRDGQLLILKNGVLYNAQGAVVK